ncbi:hypothetical protein P9209_04825 [Prescottella defluvii]|nr:hypothetical protein P9209_04825 [Prescottella defluvii]
MVDILHRVGIKSASVDDVYAALTTVDGLAGWWASDTGGDPNVGGYSSSVSEQADSI